MSSALITTAVIRVFRLLCHSMMEEVHILMGLLFIHKPRVREAENHCNPCREKGGRGGGGGGGGEEGIGLGVSEAHLSSTKKQSHAMQHHSSCTLRNSAMVASYYHFLHGLVASIKWYTTCSDSMYVCHTNPH